MRKRHDLLKARVSQESSKNRNLRELAQFESSWKLMSRWFPHHHNFIYSVINEHSLGRPIHEIFSQYGLFPTVVLSPLEECTETQWIRLVRSHPLSFLRSLPIRLYMEPAQNSGRRPPHFNCSLSRHDVATHARIQSDISGAWSESHTAFLRHDRFPSVLALSPDEEIPFSQSSRGPLDHFRHC